MSRLKVKILPENINGRKGYDIRILSNTATVQDYLDAINKAIENNCFYRSRAVSITDCAGCDLCCAERAPLTWVDLCRLREYSGDSSATVQALLDRFGYVVVDGPVVDIMLKRGQDNRCILLDRKTKLCAAYMFRPLVCQTFICCALSRRAELLREAVVNKGEDELVRQWLWEARASKRNPLIHEGYRAKPDLRDWPSTPFAGRVGYQEVFLKDICPEKLWRELIKNEERDRNA
jgi:Fe-S-cluster containining protein